MNQNRRTTLRADKASLETLEREARRRGVALTVLLAEAVDEKAATLRAARRPRVGLGRSTEGAAAAVLASEPVAEPYS